MKTKMKRLTAVLLLTVLALSAAAAAAEAAPRASVQIARKSVSLQVTGSSLYLSFDILANQTVDEIGVINLILVDETTGSKEIYSGKTASGMKEYSDKIKLDGAVKGHTYHAVVACVAQHVQETVTTPSKTF